MHLARKECTSNEEYFNIFASIVRGDLGRMRCFAHAAGSCAKRKAFMLSIEYLKMCNEERSWRVLRNTEQVAVRDRHPFRIV